MGKPNHTENSSIKDAPALSQILATIEQKADNIENMSTALSILFIVDEEIEFDELGEKVMPERLRSDFIRGGLRIAMEALADQINTLSDEITHHAREALSDTGNTG